MTKTKTSKRSKRRAAISKKTRPHRNKRLPKGPHGGIELLLIQTVDTLGKQGEVVEVRPGYAYNFLIPQGLATVATDHHKRMVDKHRAKLEALAASRLQDLRHHAGELAKQSVTIEANATDEGQLYGSVGAPEIVAALKRNDVTINADQVKLTGPLKELGLYTVVVRLSADVEAELKVWVVPMATDEEG